MELEFLREDFKQAYKNDPVLKKEVDDMFEYLENYFLDPKSKSDDNSVQTFITDYLSKFLGDEKINLPGLIFDENFYLVKDYVGLFTSVDPFYII